MDKVVHFEIPAESTPRAKKFYEDVFGWKIKEVPDMEYTLLYTSEVDGDMMPKEKGAINGGMMKKSASVKHPVITISVENLDESSQKIKKAGGKIVSEKMKVGDMGWASYFKDTEGNVIGMWQNA
ncbi:Glyoxalase/Bleomycin resistance protein/Dioxygenase superfamily protein [uncultured archaeon]|nr:Glyoxalase/Bleomycin resistance protein/Dioxygenase superfamily protein [uncultured archaeon]